MNSYRYIARHGGTGERIEGVMEAETPQDILGWLRDKSMTPLAVELHVEAVVEKKTRGRRRFRVRSEDMASLCWQLNTMIEGGVPITEAIDTIAEDIDNLKLQRVLYEIGEKLKAGETFTDAVQEYPNIFNTLFCAMILAGESSGTLPTALSRLADYYERRDALKRKVKAAVSYPLFAIGFIVLIVVVMMVFVVPRFLDMFSSFQNQLPPITLAFIKFYEFMRDHILYILAAGAGLVIFLVLFGRSGGGHRLYSRLALRLPLMGNLLRFAFVATFGRTMSTLLGSGVPILDALKIVTRMSANDVIRETLENIHTRVVEGEPIARSMGGNKIFPRLMVKTVQVGEDSGSLPEVLERVSVFYERKVDSAIQAMLGLLEPLLIVVVGGIVLVVLLALYMPIFTMSDIAK
ncbi:MAG: type II secretion system F family protein [Phycisphaerae bacterium]|nr:type II secretion system F family protein [Phycisphaerae bacterium]